MGCPKKRGMSDCSIVCFIDQVKWNKNYSELSLNHTFLWNQIANFAFAVSRPHSQTANLGSFMASFQHFGPFGPQAAGHGSFMATFQPFALSMR